MKHKKETTFVCFKTSNYPSHSHEKTHQVAFEVVSSITSENQFSNEPHICFLLVTKWTTCQILGFFLRLKMRKLKMRLYFNNIMIKTMTRMIQIVSSRAKVRKAHLLWLSNLIIWSQMIQVTHVSLTMNLVKMCMPWTNKLHAKIQMQCFAWIHKHQMNMCHNQNHLDSVCENKHWNKWQLV